MAFTRQSRSEVEKFLAEQDLELSKDRINCGGGNYGKIDVLGDIVRFSAENRCVLTVVGVEYWPRDFSFDVFEKSVHSFEATPDDLRPASLYHRVPCLPMALVMEIG